MKTTWLSWLLALACIVSPALRADDALGLAGEDCPDAAQSVLAGDHVGEAPPASGIDGAITEGVVAEGSSIPCGPTRIVRDTIWERQEITCYKTMCDRIIEQKEIDCVRYETERSFKEVEYTVTKPVWETRSRIVNYTVSKPVWETITKEIPYTVCKPVYETREQTYTVCKPVQETRTREVPYTVCKQVWEMRERDVCRTICKPVHFTKTVKVCSGRWETECFEVPGPVITRCVREPGCWVWDECQCKCVYHPGKVTKVEEQCPSRTVTKKVWVPETIEKEIACVRYERETIVEKQCYKVCRMVSEQRVKTCTYTVCRMVPEQRVRTYQVCRMVPEQRVRTCNYQVCRMVPEKRVRSYQV